MLLILTPSKNISVFLEALFLYDLFLWEML